MSLPSTVMTSVSIIILVIFDHVRIAGILSLLSAQKRGIKNNEVNAGYVVSHTQSVGAVLDGKRQNRHCLGSGRKLTRGVSRSIDLIWLERR